MGRWSSMLVKMAEQGGLWSQIKSMDPRLSHGLAGAGIGALGGAGLGYLTGRGAGRGALAGAALGGGVGAGMGHFAPAWGRPTPQNMQPLNPYPEGTTVEDVVNDIQYTQDAQDHMDQNFFDPVFAQGQQAFQNQTDNLMAGVSPQQLHIQQLVEQVRAGQLPPEVLYDALPADQQAPVNPMAPMEPAYPRGGGQFA